jgi:uncharacterized protein YjlB
VTTDEMRFDPGEGIPNNPNLPVMVYREVPALSRGAAACEQVFEANGWGGTWRNGVFSYHHFHSTSHEVLGVVSGRATLALGGPQGEQVDVHTGDALVLPAGTGHKRARATADFLVVGAYPPGQEDYDILRGDPGELEAAMDNIKQVELPEADPVEGVDGPLIAAWRLTT